VHVIAVTLFDDLMFASRVAEAARATGIGVQRVRTADAVREACASGPAIVFVDLDRPALPLADIVEAAGPGARIVGFFSHVEPEKGREARALGFTRVLPRSAFVKELPALLQPAS
jgi:hypothetical protein